MQRKSRFIGLPLLFFCRILSNVYSNISRLVYIELYKTEGQRMRKMMRNFKKAAVLLSIMLILISVFLSGCNIIEKLFINDLMPKREVKKENPHTKAESNTVQKSDKSQGTQLIESSNNVKSNNQEIIADYKVILFFSNKDASGFVQEERKINKASGLAKETILELIKGPKDKNKGVITIPQGTKLNNIVIKDSICYVDFSKELQKNHWGGSAGEYMTVYSIVKTLCQFSSINKVQILIEGNKVTTLAGHIDISKPMERPLK